MIIFAAGGSLVIAIMLLLSEPRFVASPESARRAPSVDVPGLDRQTDVAVPEVALREPPLARSTGYPPKTESEKAMWKWYKSMEKADPTWQWKRKIAFYGKVIDENGAPIAEASVRFSRVGSWNTGNPMSSTDIGGHFSMEAAHGKLLTVSVSKPGYYSGKESHGGFEYAEFFQDIFHVPDPNNPVIFRLRKKGEAEPMYFWRPTKELQADGTPHWFDFKSGKLAERGDLAFVVTRSNQT